MANSVIHKAYTQTATSILTTQMDGLTNGSATAASSAIDNTTNLDLFIDFELALAVQGSSRSAGATCTVYIAPSLDGGSTYPDILSSTCESLATFYFDAATTARTLVRINRDIPPGLFKLFLVNNTGQTLNASGNTLRYRTHSINNNG